MSTPPIKPSIEELRDKLTEALTMEYLKAKDKKDSKPIWLQVLESTGFATLVTVLIGGLIGTGLTYMFQSREKEREQNSAIAQLQRERELAAFNQHLERERKTVDEMTQKLGTFVDASADLAELSRTEWNRPHKQRERQKIVNRYNVASQQWLSYRVRLSLLLQLENDNDTELQNSFKTISDRADEYARCADRWRTLYSDLNSSEAQSACHEFRTNLDGAINSFAERLTDLRRRVASGGQVKGH
jgi:hypothetical protein